MGVILTLTLFYTCIFALTSNLTLRHDFVTFGLILRMDLFTEAIKPLKWKNICIFTASGFLNEGDEADIHKESCNLFVETP